MLNKNRLVIIIVSLILVLSTATTVNAGSPWNDLAIRFDEVWDAINGLLSSSGIIQGDIAALEATITEQSTMITSLEAENSALRDALSELESRIALIEHSPPQGLPAYDSGWVPTLGSSVLMLDHMLGSTDVYVYVMGKSGIGVADRVDGIVASNEENSIFQDEVYYEEIRVLIWLLPGPPTGVNSAPYAIARPVTGHEGRAVNLYAIDSYDPDGDALQYRWDFDNDGVWDTDWSTESMVSHLYTDDARGSYRLEVSDGELTTSTTAALNIQNVVPTAEILGYEMDGYTVTFHADWSDPGDDSWAVFWYFAFDETNPVADYVSPMLTPESYVNSLGEREWVWSPEQLEIVEAALNPTHVYSGPGTYRVLMFVIDDDIPDGEMPGLSELVITIP